MYKYKQLELIERELEYMHRNPVGFVYNRGGLEKAREYFKKLKNKRKELMEELMFN